MIPEKIKLHKASGDLELHFPGESAYVLSSEYLRVFSPSAEVMGHGPGQEVLQWGKQQVKIASLERSGNYALRIAFDDGHDSGIYSWDYLYGLCRSQDDNWARYLDKLRRAGKSRDPYTQVVQLHDPQN